MFKKPFNKTIGENRECKKCGLQFHTFKPRYTCNACLNVAQKVIEQKKRDKYQKKPTYPFNVKGGKAASRFCSIRTAISKAWREYKKTGNRDVMAQHYDKQLKEIEENGILKWIIDRRDKESLNDKKVKSKTNIQKDYPSYHDYYEY